MDMCTGGFDCKPPLIIQKQTFQYSETFNMVIDWLNGGAGIARPGRSIVRILQGKENSPSSRKSKEALRPTQPPYIQWAPRGFHQE